MGTLSSYLRCLRVSTSMGSLRAFHFGELAVVLFRMACLISDIYFPGNMHNLCSALSTWSKTTLSNVPSVLVKKDINIFQSLISWLIFYTEAGKYVLKYCVPDF